MHRELSQQGVPSENDWGLDKDLSGIPGEKKLDLTDVVNLLNRVVAKQGLKGRWWSHWDPRRWGTGVRGVLLLRL